MPGNLRLRCAQNLDEVADTDLLLSQEIEESEARWIAESLKEPGQVELFVAGHASYICVDGCICKCIYSPRRICSEVKHGRDS